MNLTLSQIALLAGIALIAGTIDAIAGGGGLITVPALLAAGLPAHLALGTNKGQSVWGSFAATLAFWRSGKLDPRRARVTFPLGLLGSFAGAALVLRVPPSVLRPVVLAMLVAVALLLLARRPPSVQITKTPLERARWIAALIALIIGAYDGFFGPGSGTFLIVSFTVFLGESMTNATADAKVVNFASNLAAVMVFAMNRSILWSVALPMAAGQFIGGIVGARLAVRGGERMIRAVVLLVVIALVVKLGRDLYLAR